MIAWGPMCRFICLEYLRKCLGYYSKYNFCDCVVKRYVISVTERYVNFAAEMFVVVF